MSFNSGGRPPPSKYSYAELNLGGLGLSDDEDEWDDGMWMCSSATDNNKKKPSFGMNKTQLDQVESFGDKNDKKFQRFTAQDWLEKIEEKYFDERDDLVRQCFQAALEDVEDPYSFILHVIYRAFFDLHSKRIPITFYGIDEFSIWLDWKKQNNEAIPQPTVSHKSQACEYVCRNGYNYLNKITSLYQLDQGDNSFLVNTIPIDNLKSKKLKETVITIYTLKLQDHFHAEDIMLPLIANDQMQVLETYIEDDVKRQIDYVNVLNNLCGMTQEEIQYKVSMMELKIKDSSKLQHKTLTKIAEKAVKRYNLNPDDYPQIFEAKNINGLFYLVRNKLKEEQLNNSLASVQKWDNLIETAVTGKVWLQIKLIEKFCNLNELEHAVNWSVLLQIHPKQLSKRVAETLLEYAGGYEYEIAYNSDDNHLVVNDSESTQSGSTSVVESEDWESEIESDQPRAVFAFGTGFVDEKALQDEFYSLSLHRENIHVIDSLEKLENIFPILFVNGQVIGFDAEWKPTLCRAGEQDRVSILQLAIKGSIFIIDLFKLYVIRGAEYVLEKFFFNFFTSPTVIKIGYGITGDVKILMEMFSFVKEYVLNSKCLVDLCEIGQKILSSPMAIPYLYPAKKSALTEKGLSLLINKVLGKGLDKTFQLSDWERRPLSEKQINYAALDAYCLLELYQELHNIVRQTGLKINLKENVKLKWLKPKKNYKQRKDKYEKSHKKEKVPDPDDSRPLFKGPPRPSTSLKVICDTMLQGLGRQLRSCGVDTIILDNQQDHSTAVQISHRDNRAILTRGKPYFSLRSYVREGMCMWVPDGNLKEQMKMVFTRFNIALQTKDILSRCCYCNSDEYEKVDSKDMKQAFDLKYELNDAEMPDTQMTQSGQINLSTFTLRNGIELQLDFLSPTRFERAKNEDSLNQLFDRVDFFYTCKGCGKVYWEGSHHGAVRKNFKDLIDKREVDEYYYGTPR